MDLGLSQILPFERDPGDRNRTSPFAFTGNRFEFRAVGSSQSVSGPLVAMNTILADSLDWISDQIEPLLAAGIEPDAAVAEVLKDLMELHGAAVFGGDGYASEWHEAAVTERGLRNIPNTAEALPVLIEPDVLDLFERTGVLSPVELQSRYEVYAEQYVMSIQVEARLVVELSRTMCYPAALAYATDVATAVNVTADAGLAFGTSELGTLTKETESMVAAVDELETAMSTAGFADVAEEMTFAADTLVPLMAQVRAHADALEGRVADAYWPLPKYRELLFIK